MIDNKIDKIKTKNKTIKKNPKLLKRKRQQWFRMLVQAVFFILAPSVYSSAFTAVKNAFANFGEGLPLEITPFVTQFFVVIVFTVLFGRFFCGWSCAFGALNDWVYAFSQFVQKKLQLKFPRIPDKIVPVLQWLKYFVLVFVLWLCFKGNSSVVSQNSPWTVFSLLRSGHLDLSGYATAIVLLVILVIGMAFHERFFCQFFCPMGAIFALLPAMPFLRLKRDYKNCPERCGACQKVCPVNLLMEDDSPRQGECIRCGRCSGVCPRDNISTCAVFKGDEWYLDAVKAVILLLLVLAFN